MDIKSIMVAFLSCWECAEPPAADSEYLRGQTESLSQILTMGGWSIEALFLADQLRRAAEAVSAGGDSKWLGEELYFRVADHAEAAAVGARAGR